MIERTNAHAQRKTSAARNSTRDISHLIGSVPPSATSAEGFAELPASLTSRVQWYLDRQDEAPDRLHVKAVADDGTPDWSTGFKRWIYGEQAVRTEISEGHCDHVTRRPGELCGRCSVYDAEGSALVETGRYRVTRRLYVYPMRAAVARLRRVHVPEGMPSIPTILFALAATGSPTAAVDSLIPDYPALADGGRAFGHLAFALRRVEEAYSVEPRPNFGRRRRSDAQLDAEANL